MACRSFFNTSLECLVPASCRRNASRASGGGAISFSRIKALSEGIAVLAMKDRDPPRLLTKISQNAIIFLSEDPDALLCVAAAEGQL